MDNKDSDNDSIVDLYTLMSEENSLENDDDTNMRSIMKLDELISTELKNLELLKSANVNMGKCVTATVVAVKTFNTIATTSSASTSEQQEIAETDCIETSTSTVHPNSDNSSKNDKDMLQTQSNIGEPIEIESIANVTNVEENGCNDLKMDADKAENEAITTTAPQKPSQNLFRGLPTLRRRKAGQKNAMAVNDFIKDYYRSLDTVSRYIIIASLLSFITAFTLLYFHGYQTHQHNMELFKMKEKQTQAQLEHYEASKSQSTNFRETIIHQRYEETRQCQVSLKSCSTNNGALTTKIAKVEKDSSVLKLKLETELKSKDGKIKQLQETVKKLEEANKELKTMVSQSVHSSFTQITMGFLNLLKNPAVYGYTLAFGAVLFFIMACASK